MALLDEPQGFIDESSVSPQQVIFKWTAISAAVTIIFTLVNSMLGLTTKGLGTLMLVFFIGIFIGILIYIYAVREHRDQELGGFISFKRVFLIVFVIMIISSVLGQAFNFIYMNYINPSAMDQALEATKDMLEKMNVSDDIIDKSIQQAEDGMKNPVSILKNSIFSLIIGAIIAAIMGAAMKKERPTFG